MTNEEFATAIKDGDTGLMPQLWEQVRRFVVLSAKSFLNRCSENGLKRTTLDDLVQCGYLALVAAVRYYDPQKSFKLTTYLGKTLLNAFNEELGFRGKVDPMDRLIVSLNMPIGEENDTELLDFLDDPESAADFEHVVESIYNQQLRYTLDAALEVINPKSADILRLHFFFGFSFESIAESWKLHPNYVRYLASDGLMSMRYGKYGELLHEFLFGYVAEAAIDEIYETDAAMQEEMRSLFL